MSDTKHLTVVPNNTGFVWPNYAGLIAKPAEYRLVGSFSGTATTRDASGDPEKDNFDLNFSRISIRIANRFGGDKYYCLLDAGGFKNTYGLNKDGSIKYKLWSEFESMLDILKILSENLRETKGVQWLYGST